jgi:predicted RNase H-like nuclease (RuvC/YqgF family)
MLDIKEKLIAAGIVLVICLSIYGAQEWRIAGLNEEISDKTRTITTLTGNLAVADANVAKLEAAVQTQNNAIEKLRLEKAALDAKVRQNALSAREKRVSGVSIEGSGPDSMNKFFGDMFK